MQLSHKQPDGATLRDHLLAAARQTGRADPRLTQAIAPAAAALWGTFGRLSRTRAHGFSGPQPIGPQDLQAWCQLQRVHLTSWEVDTLAEMDAALLRTYEQEANP